jgi:hypothetical protein
MAKKRRSPAAKKGKKVGDLRPRKLGSVRGGAGAAGVAAAAQAAAGDQAGSNAMATAQLKLSSAASSASFSQNLVKSALDNTTR